MSMNDEEIIHEVTIEDDDGDAWAICAVTGFRGLGMDMGATIAVEPGKPDRVLMTPTAVQRAVATCDRGCKGAKHKIKESTP